MLASQQLHYVALDPRVTDLQQRLADRFTEARLLPRPIKVAEAFDDRYNPLLPHRP